MNYGRYCPPANNSPAHYTWELLTGERRRWVYRARYAPSHLRARSALGPCRLFVSPVHRNAPFLSRSRFLLPSVRVAAFRVVPRPCLLGVRYRGLFSGRFLLVRGETLVRENTAARRDSELSRSLVDGGTRASRCSGITGNERVEFVPRIELNGYSRRGIASSDGGRNRRRGSRNNVNVCSRSLRDDLNRRNLFIDSPSR